VFLLESLVSWFQRQLAAKLVPRDFVTIREKLAFTSEKSINSFSLEDRVSLAMVTWRCDSSKRRESLTYLYRRFIPSAIRLRE